MRKTRAQKRRSRKRVRGGNQMVNIDTIIRYLESLKTPNRLNKPITVTRPMPSKTVPTIVNEPNVLPIKTFVPSTTPISVTKATPLNVKRLNVNKPNGNRNSMQVKHMFHAADGMNLPMKKINPFGYKKKGQFMNEYKLE